MQEAWLGLLSIIAGLWINVFGKPENINPEIFVDLHLIFIIIFLVRIKLPERKEDIAYE